MEIKNFFKFLEGKGKDIPFKLKIGFFPEEIKPEDLNVTGDLDLLGCTSLVSLPKGLNVTGNLALDSCTSLVSLPKGLKVNGNLFISKKLLDKYGGKEGIRKFIEDNGGYVKGNVVLW